MGHNCGLTGSLIKTFFVSSRGLLLLLTMGRTEAVIYLAVDTSVVTTITGTGMEVLPGVDPGGTLLSLRGWNRLEGSKECRVSLKGAPDHGHRSIRRQWEPKSVVNYQKRSCSWRGHRIPALPLRLSPRFNRFSLLRSAGGEAVNQPEKHGKRLISRRLRGGEEGAAGLR